jgi:hypothetical protein
MDGNRGLDGMRGFLSGLPRRFAVRNDGEAGLPCRFAVRNDDVKQSGR